MATAIKGAGQKKCEQCGKMFKPKQFYQRFHSRKCRNDFHSKQRSEAIKGLRAAAQTETKGPKP